MRPGLGVAEAKAEFLAAGVDQCLAARFGQKLPERRKVPDLLIAAAAEAQGLIVLHYDGDYDLIGRVTGQPCAWVVAAGIHDATMCKLRTPDCATQTSALERST